MDARRKWLDDDAETLAEPEAHAPVKIGARQEKRQIDFVPRKGNRAFNHGRGKSIEYAHLLDIDYELDYGELVLNFTHCRIIAQGRNLEVLKHLIQSHHADTVREESADPMHAARANPLRFAVTALILEENRA
jgi:hypothetical protein